MNKSRLKYRMYFFVPYNISDIQKGIQAGHAALEYAAKYYNDESFQNFIFWDKTWIILNGGTSNDCHFGNPKGSMEELYNEIKDNHIPCVKFNEPDLNCATTAICFLADERVWDYETYPNFVDYITNVVFPRNRYEPSTETYIELKLKDEETLKHDYKSIYIEWTELIGGEKNVFLRKLLSNKILA